MSSSEKSILAPELEAIKRTERIRVFVAVKGSAKPAPGVSIKIVAELVNSQTGDAREVPVAFLESDRYGYLSYGLGKLARNSELRHVWLRPNDDPELQVDAFPVIDAHTDPAVVTVELPEEVVPIRYEGPTRASIPDPDPTDWTMSPGSFASNEPLKLGEGGCEELLHSRQAEHTFRFVQLIRNNEAPKMLREADPAQCEAGPQSHDEFAEGFAPPYVERCYRRGVMLEYEISWKPLGHGLGRVLYSLPLAPCESVDLAIIDWQREDEIVRTEDTLVTEQLSHIQRRERDIEESVNASLSETQFGGSFMTGAAGAIAGSWKMIDFGATSAMGGALSGTQGKRELAADTTQRVIDSISQATSAMRRLNSTVVVQASQAEREVIQTRTVTNHNHCHALTMLYYEVLRHYLTSVRLVYKQDVIFVKYRPVNDFHDTFVELFTEETVFHYHRILKQSLLDPALECGFAAVGKFLCQRENFDRRRSEMPPSDYEIGTIEARFTTGQGIVYPEGSDSRGTHTMPVPVRIWLVTEAEQKIALTHEGDYFWHPGGLARPSDELIGYTEAELETSSATRAFTAADQEDLFTLRPVERIRWERVSAIEIEARPISWELKHLQLRTRHGREIWMMFDAEVNHNFTDNNVDGIRRWRLNPYGPASPADLLTEEEYCCKQGLLRHLNHNKLYYSRAIWLAQDREERARAFERYRLEIPDPTGSKGATIAGRLADLIENRIVGFGGDYVAFPLTVTDPSLDANEEFERGQIKAEQVISLPTRGVFAEAKLSHCNACEERDITRYWDWTESPCPEPPAIAEIEAGKHVVTELPEGTPTTMPSPVVNIVNPPNIPDPTGLAAALEVLRTPDIFRDMSATSELSELLQELAEGAVSLVQARQRAQDILKSSERTSGRQTGTAGTTSSRREGPQELHDRGTVIDRAIDRGLQDGSISEDEARDMRRRMADQMVSTIGDGGSGAQFREVEYAESGGSTPTADCGAYEPIYPNRLIIDQVEYDAPTPDFLNWKTGNDVYHLNMSAPTGICPSKCRNIDQINAIVLHETGGWSIDDPNSVPSTWTRNGVGAHFVVHSDSSVAQHYDATHCLWHAGRRRSRTSVGIELVNAVWTDEAVLTPPRTAIDRTERQTVPSWAPGQGSYYIVPPLHQLETLYVLLESLLSHLSIPRVWLSLDHESANHLFLMNFWESIYDCASSACDRSGIYSHINIGNHSDGAFPALYTWLRGQVRFSSSEAYRVAQDLVTNNMVVEHGHRFVDVSAYVGRIVT